MLRSANEVTGYEIDASDGGVGKVDDFYFDDVGWFVRYLVADTGGWLVGRKVLLSPEVLGEPDWKHRKLPVNISKETIEESPPIEEDAPVSRQQEERLRTFYGWASWWGAPMYGVLVPPPRDVLEKQSREVAIASGDADPHLRSAGEVIGYHIEANDGEIGHVEDLIVDDRDWAIRYLVVDTRDILPGKKVLLSPHWIAAIRWSDRKVAAELGKKEIEGAPEFSPEEPVNRRYEERLYDYYGRPKYWA